MHFRKVRLRRLGNIGKGAKMPDPAHDQGMDKGGVRKAISRSHQAQARRGIELQTAYELDQDFFVHPIACHQFHIPIFKGIEQACQVFGPQGLLGRAAAATRAGMAAGAEHINTGKAIVAGRMAWQPGGLGMDGPAAEVVVFFHHLGGGLGQGKLSRTHPAV